MTWKGQFRLLAVQPVPTRAKFSDPDYYSWCGTMVRGDEGECHLFDSR